MGVEEFLELFIKELEVNKDLRNYYRLLNNKEPVFMEKGLPGTKAEIRIRHLEYSCRHHLGCRMRLWLQRHIFLALTAINVLGNTLEFYL